MNQPRRATHEMRILLVEAFLLVQWMFTDNTAARSAPKCWYSPPVFRCRSTQQCIPTYFACDGEKDCRDGSDEEQCAERECPGESYFRCSNGQCIPGNWRCDYHGDCPHGEDEQEGCPAPTCQTDQFVCRTYTWNTPYCMPKNWRCDKFSDCVDGSDEEMCTYRTCQTEDFRCHDTHLCIQKEKKCDGVFDCRNNSDELACFNRTSCYRGQVLCNTGDRCIAQSDLCNDRDDCGDGSDEQNCVFSYCDPGIMLCANGKCVPEERKCNGKDDCGDGSDERNCTACSGDFFACAGQCTQKSKVCDGSAQCSNGDGAARRSQHCAADSLKLTEKLSLVTFT